MNYRIAYGVDTGSIEDHTQLVLLDLPDECADLDTEELGQWITWCWDAPEHIIKQEMVGYTDVIESLALILNAYLNEDMVSNIITSLNDAFTNNDN